MICPNAPSTIPATKRSRDHIHDRSPQPSRLKLLPFGGTMASPWSTYRGPEAGDVPFPVSSAPAATQPDIPPPPTTEPPMSAGYPETGGYIVVWQVEDWGCWIDYDKDFCRVLEEAREKRQRCSR